MLRFLGINLVVASSLSLLLFFVQLATAQEVMPYVLVSMTTSILTIWFHTKLLQKVQNANNKTAQ